MERGDTSNTLRIGLIGDYSPDVRAHAAIPQALSLAAASIGRAAGAQWLATELLASEGAGDEQLKTFDALWCVPGSPYASMDGALRAIRFARENAVPFLGTCGGFQHTLIEYARHVIGLTEADHLESNPAAAVPLIAPLSCSLVRATGEILLQEGSRARAIYGTTETTEEYYCNFGFNSRYRSVLDGGALRVTGVDGEGEVRVIELDGHPFFLATLFQPELSALAGSGHPLITAYVRAVARH